MIHICIPVHNEERTIGVLLWKVRKVMADFGRDYEILVLDDASTDDTSQILERYGKILPVQVIRSEVRIGHGRATERLLRLAAERTEYPKRDVAVTLQGDFTEDPGFLVDMVKAIEGGADLVAGRLDQGDLPRNLRWSRRAASLLLRRVLRKAPVSDPLSGFRAYRIVVLRKAFREMADETPLITENGWAANVQLLAGTVRHARRVEESPMRMRFDHRHRESRFRPWHTLKSLLPLRRVVWPAGLAALVIATALVATVAEVGAQEDPSPWAGPVERTVAPVPFGPGERAIYQVKLGPVPVGEGRMEVHRIESVRGSRTYRLSMSLSGGIPLARVNNSYESWLDVDKLTSRRFIQDQHEVRYTRFRHFEFFPEERRWERADVEEGGELPTDLPLDDISFVYYVRSLPLEVGETYTLDRYFQESGNPVVVNVVRRDTVDVPAGSFPTIVVEPIIQTRGIFGDGGEAEIHFSDDDRRILVQMRSRMPVVGSLSLHLREVSYGRPLRNFHPLAEEGNETSDR